MSETVLPTLGRVMARMQFRLTLLALGLAGLGAMLTSGIVIDNYVQQNLQLVGNLASYVAEPAIVFRDREAAQSAIALLADRNDVRAIVVTGPRGFRVIADRLPQTRMLARLKERLAAAFWSAPVRVPIRHDGRVIGEVRVYAGFGGLSAYLWLGLGCALACLLIAIWFTHIVAVRLQRRVMEPLRAIASVAHRVRIERALHLRAPPAPIAEIDMLGRDFNALLGELESWEAHLRSENETLAHRAMHDPLTGLANRALLEERLESAMHVAASARTTLGLLYVDADDFKALNDRHGHAAGDLLLTEFAARLRTRIRHGDLAARVGGDEFAILVAPPAGRAETTTLATHIAEAMTEPVVLPNGSEVVLTASIGIAVFPDDGPDPAGLLHAADAAMYAHKRLRRSRRSPAPHPTPIRT
jgi:diguanylate cyclase (GGDEF)-like protein